MSNSLWKDEKIYCTQRFSFLFNKSFTLLCILAHGLQWGFVNIVAYIVIAMVNKYYGQVLLNALYYIPTQFIGMYMWKRHMNEEKKDDDEKPKKKEVKPKKEKK